MKGIVLAGGTGSRLWPVTKAVSKQLLPVYDKPMIYYPIATLMMAGIREILIITSPNDYELFKSVLGDGDKFGVKFTYTAQPKPEGLAQALIIGEEFLSGDSCLMILGDNIFHGAGLGHELVKTLPNVGAHIFTYEVSDPSQYGVLTLDSSGKAESIEEKPERTNSKLAITGLYFFDGSVSEIAKNVSPSKRGELEITSVLQQYLDLKLLTFTQLSRGVAWLDTGSPTSMHDASTYVRVIEERTGLKIACLEEIALQNQWITVDKLEIITKNSYNLYLEKISKRY
jgi:glucose-1-phosphate thymidylyltransferase